MLSPMMSEYVKTKEEYKDCILFYRLGDFYEMFFDDAIIASKVLDIVLTGKDCGLEERAPMCGIPFHAMEGYLSKLIENGYKVAICEQVEDPKKAKGLVKREVVRVVTPGTNINLSYLDETENNYLLSIYFDSDTYGISFIDLSTGDFFTTEVDSFEKLVEELRKYSPSEIICNELFEISGNSWPQDVVVPSVISRAYFDDRECNEVLKKQLRVMTLAATGLNEHPLSLIASGALLQYIYNTQKTDISHILKVSYYETGNYMIIDNFTRRNLELFNTLREKQKKGSLLWVIDKTKTAMGGRLLKSYMERPLVSEQEINERLDAVDELNGKFIDREEAREYLNSIYDLERLMSRVSLRTVNPRDLLALKNSIFMIKDIRALLKDKESTLLKELYENMDELTDIYELLENSISEDAPLTVREGNIIKTGYDSEIDLCRSASVSGKEWIARLEAEEKEKTGIKNLRIKYNKVFGYYLEVTNSFLNMVPETWIRKQTLTGAERYITQELKEIEDTILGAQDKLNVLEYDAFCVIREQVLSQVGRILSTAKAIACTDVLCSFSYVSTHNGYVRPSINTTGVINIKEGRHPVVEKMIQDGLFITNDTYLDNEKERIALITGPNMAGKSTYMRQCALIVYMAQLGMYVPAKTADISIVDRIFTRVGASDDLSSGQSTFMVEMIEVANILNNATDKSLVILDEIGRGTSTYDGMSIARSVVEYLSRKKEVAAKTMFATHYHELTKLPELLPNVQNYSIAVKENDDDIIFLRKIIKKGADRSYGIQVAKLAGLPDEVILRAKEILAEIIDSMPDNDEKVISAAVPEEKQPESYETDMPTGQLSLFSDYKNDIYSKSYNIEFYLDIIKELENKDINNMTPMDAIKTLDKLQRKIRKRK